MSIVVLTVILKPTCVRGGGRWTAHWSRVRHLRGEVTLGKLIGSTDSNYFLSECVCVF